MRAGDWTANSESRRSIILPRLPPEETAPARIVRRLNEGRGPQLRLRSLPLLRPSRIRVPGVCAGLGSSRTARASPPGPRGPLREAMVGPVSKNAVFFGSVYRMVVMPSRLQTKSSAHGVGLAGMRVRSGQIPHQPDCASGTRATA
jgi:hypothetical protein